MFRTVKQAGSGGYRDQVTADSSRSRPGTSPAGREGLAERSDLRDRTRGERRDDLLGDRFPGGVGDRAVAGADLLGAPPPEFDLDVTVVGGPRRLGAGLVAFGAVLDPGAQDVPDPMRRVVLAAPVAVDLLLHPTPDLVGDRGRELDDMERVQDRAGVFELVIDGVLVPVETGSTSRSATRCRNASPRSVSQVVYTCPDRPGTRSSSRARTLPCSSRDRSIHPGQLFRCPDRRRRRAWSTRDARRVQSTPEDGDALEP
jgi:hypothetical protein